MRRMSHLLWPKNHQNSCLNDSCPKILRFPSENDHFKMVWTLFMKPTSRGCTPSHTRHRQSHATPAGHPLQLGHSGLNWHSVTRGGPPVRISRGTSGNPNSVQAVPPELRFFSLWELVCQCVAPVERREQLNWTLLIAACWRCSNQLWGQPRA